MCNYVFVSRSCLVSKVQIKVVAEKKNLKYSSKIAQKPQQCRFLSKILLPSTVRASLYA